MANKRILDETTASVAASDDYLYIDGQTNGSRKITPENIVLNSTTAQLLAQHIADAAQDLASVQGDISDIQDDVTDLRADLGDLAELDTTDKSSIVNAINEVAGGSSSGLTADIKQALLQIAQKVAYIDDDGQDYYDDLYDALYPPAELVSISAVYTQSGTVYDTDTLDSLKTDLVVTANYDDSTTETVTTYTLSGTLTEGTSTITVAYGGKTTTFTVTVTHAVQTYVTDGLIARWDGIDNTANGHDASATTWEDLVGNYDIAVPSGNATWTSDGLVFSGSQARNIKSSSVWSAMDNTTIEIVAIPSEARTCVVGQFDMSNNGTYSKAFMMYSDNTVGFIGQNAATYSNSESELTDIKHMVSVYSGHNVVKALINGDQLSASANTHSMRHNTSYILLGDQDASANYAFKGTIKSIRVYNRQLTDAEIAQNYAVDVDRFSLS